MTREQAYQNLCSVFSGSEEMVERVLQKTSPGSYTVTIKEFNRMHNVIQKMISRSRVSPNGSPDKKVLNTKVSFDRIDMALDRNNSKSGLIKPGVLSPMKQYQD